MPLNLRFAGREWPVGLAITTLLLGLVAIANLFSKRIATIWGVSFTVVFFILFKVSERINARKLKEKKVGLEEFNRECCNFGVTDLIG